MRILQDFRYSWRALWQHPLLTLVVILSLALGSGVNIAIFSVIHKVFFDPLPVRDPASLAAVYTTTEKTPGLLMVSHPNYEDFRDTAESIDGLALYQWIPVNLSMGDEPEHVFGQIVSGNYFDVLGIEPSAGRFFTPEEDLVAGQSPVVVLSYGLWQRQFGGDPQIVNSTVSLNRQTFTVIGVAKQGFQGINIGMTPELWLPTMMYETMFPFPFNTWLKSRRALMFHAITRLGSGVTLEQANADLARIARNLEQEYPKANEGRSVKLVPLVEATLDPRVRGEAVDRTLLLAAAAALVLLLGYGNVLSLLFARMMARRSEINIRLCLGARRVDLLRQQLSESLILGVLGGALGFLLAISTRRLVTMVEPPSQIPVALSLDFGLPVFLFSIGLALLTALVLGFGLVVQAGRADIVSGLKERPAQQRILHRRFNLRNSLVVAQVSLCLVSLICTGLFVQSLRSAQKIDPGFDPENLLAVALNMGAQGYSNDRAQVLYEELLERLQRFEIIESAALAQVLPLTGSEVAQTVIPEAGLEDDVQDGVLVRVSTVSPKYFDTMKIALLEGRDFTSLDTEEGGRVAIINETMARRFWPGDSAVGKRFKFFRDKDFRQVIGVARDSKYNSLSEEPQPYVYNPLRQNFSPWMNLFVRARSDVGPIFQLVQDTLRATDPSLPVVDESTMQETLDRSLWGYRLSASLLSSFSFLALILAGTGVFSVSSYFVACREHELGIRMALGAQRQDILGMVLKYDLAIVAFGLVLGLGLSVVIVKRVVSLLYGVHSTDPRAWISAALALMLVVLLALFFATRRVLLIDPLTVIRTE